MTFIKNMEDIKSLCRICLISSNNMISLDSNLDDNCTDNPIIIIDVLENLLMVKVDGDTDYPMEICRICRGNLRIIYDLKTLFSKSQNILKKYISSLQEFHKIKPLNNEYDGFMHDVEIFPNGNDTENDEYNENDIPDLIVPQKSIKLHINTKKQNAVKVKWLEGNKFILEKNEKTSASKSHKCKQCHKIFDTEDKLSSHMAKCKKDIECKYCINKFCSERSLRCHVRLHHGSNLPIEIKCDLCNESFKNYNARSYHKITRHNTEGKKYTCEICGKAFYFKNSLSQHLECHSRDVSRVVCPICGKSFHYRGGLFYHMKIHRNERNYVCTFCSGKFLNMASLKRHTRIHTGERPYTCSFCPKTFCSVSEVRTHERRHTGQKPHKCIYCAKTFITPYNLKLHMSSHVGSQPCYVCGKSYLNAEVLKFHLEMKHSIKDQDQSSQEIAGSE